MWKVNNYYAGLYIRLSKEDENKINGDNLSESVENQKSLLLKYLKDNEIEKYNIYIDDGYSGTNFERPKFKQLLNDIENNKINMVIVKDLSRFGRDYIFTGYYLEMFFPKKNIRFVSIMDNIDTIDGNNLNFDFTPFKSIINDMYSKDNSRKIKLALRTKQELGKWVGGCTPFGYIQDSNDKNHLVINEEEAKIIRKIYSLFLSGYSINKIANYLYVKKINTPNSLRHLNKDLSIHKWSFSTIKGILTNNLYTGDLVQNRRSKISYKLKTIVRNKKEDWIVVPNTHEAIISKNDFLEVEKKFNISKNIKSEKINKYLLSGLLFCNDCKKRIVIQKSGKYFYTMCNTYRKKSKYKICTAHSSNYFLLEKEVITILEKIINRVDKNVLYNNFVNKIKTSFISIENENNELMKSLETLYFDKICKRINEKMYLTIKNKIENQIEKNKHRLCSLDKTNSQQLINNFFATINEKIIFRLINKIELHSDKSFDIYFNFIKSDFIAL